MCLDRTGASGSPFWRNSAKQDLGAEKQGSSAENKTGHFFEKGAKMGRTEPCLDRTRVSGSLFLQILATNGPGAGKQGPRHSSALHFEENAVK